MRISQFFKASAIFLTAASAFSNDVDYKFKDSIFAWDSIDPNSLSISRTINDVSWSGNGPVIHLSRINDEYKFKIEPPTILFGNFQKPISVDLPSGDSVKFYFKGDDFNHKGKSYQFGYYSTDQWRLGFWDGVKNAIIIDPVGNTYYFPQSNDRYLQKIEDIAGNTITFERDNTRLEKVTANDGRVVDLVWNSNSLKQIIVAPGPNQQITEFENASAGGGNYWTRYDFTRSDGANWTSSNRKTFNGMGATVEYSNADLTKAGRALNAEYSNGLIKNYYRSGSTSLDTTTKVTFPDKCEIHTFHRDQKDDDDNLLIAGWPKKIEYFSDNLCINLVKSVEKSYFHNNVVAYQTSETTTYFYENNLHDKYTVTWSEFDGFARAAKKTEKFESNQIGSNTYSRTTTFNYHTSTENGTLGLLKDQGVDGYGFSVSYDYYPNGLLKTKTNRGAKIEFSYYDNGLIKQIIDSNGTVNDYSDYYRGVARLVEGGNWDAYTSLDSAFQTKRHTESYTVNEFGKIRTQTINGITQEYIYDDQQRLAESITPRTDDYNFDYTHSYSVNGYSIQMNRGVVFTDVGLETEDEMGQYYLRKHYDSFGNPTQQEERIAILGDNTQIRVIDKKYDIYNRLSFENVPYYQSNPSNHGVTITYDSLNRITRRTHSADGSFIEYSYLPGNKVKISDSTGSETTRTYMSYGSPKEAYLIHELKSGSGPTGLTSPDIEISITRNDLGLIETVTNGDHSRTYHYDTNWNLDYIVTPEQGKVDFSHYPNGLLKSKQIGTGPIVEYFYDANGETIETRYNDTLSEDRFFYFDEHRRLLGSKKGNVGREYRYDLNGKLIKEILTDYDPDHESVIKFEIGYIRNSYDGVKSMVYPNGQQIDFAVDSIGQPTKITSGAKIYANDIEFYANGKLQLLTYGNGERYQAILDDKMNVESISLGTKFSQTYDYYDNGTLKKITDLKHSDLTTTLDYDQHRFLRSLYWEDNENGIKNTKSYTYNSLGQRASASYSRIYDIADLNINDSQIYNYDTTTFRLSNLNGSVNYSYDRHGNRTQYNYHKYDAQNNLVGYSSRSFEYDGNNRLFVDKKNNDSSTYHFYDTDGNRVSVITGTGVVNNYFYIGTQLIASEKSVGTVEGPFEDQCADEYDSSSGRYTEKAMYRWFAPDGSLLKEECQRYKTHYSRYRQESKARTTSDKTVLIGYTDHGVWDIQDGWKAIKIFKEDMRWKHFKLKYTRQSNKYIKSRKRDCFLHWNTLMTPYDTNGYLLRDYSEMANSKYEKGRKVERISWPWYKSKRYCPNYIFDFNHIVFDDGKTWRTSDFHTGTWGYALP